MQASAVTTTVLGSGKSVGNPMKYKGMYVRYGLEPEVWILVQVWFGFIPLASKKSTSWPPSWPVWPCKATTYERSHLHLDVPQLSNGPAALDHEHRLDHPQG